MRFLGYLEGNELSDRLETICASVRRAFSKNDLVQLSLGFLESTSLNDEEKAILEEVGFPNMEIISMFVDIPGGYPKIIESKGIGSYRWIYLNEDNGYAIAIADGSGEIYCVNCETQEPDKYVAKGVIELLELLAIVRRIFDLQEEGEYLDFDGFVTRVREIDELILDPERSWWTPIFSEIKYDVF